MKKIIFSNLWIVLLVLSAKAQDSSDAPITKRIGLICYPLDETIGITYCFGEKGEMKIENILEPDINFNPLQVGFASDETKLLYAWKSCKHKKFYSGLGVKYKAIKPIYSDHRQYVLYGSVIPVAMEWFPFKRLRGSSFLFEPEVGYDPSFVKSIDWLIHIGLCCYF